MPDHCFCCGILSCAECLHVSSMVESLGKNSVEHDVVWFCLLPGHLPVMFHEVSLGNCLPGQLSADPFQFRLYHTILFHCEVSHHSTSVKVQVGWFAGSPSIRGAVIRRCWLQYTSNLLIF